MWRGGIENIPLHNSEIEYNTGEVSRKEADEHIEDMLRLGIIEELQETDEGYFSPIILLKKSDGSIRQVTDFKCLNELVPLGNVPSLGH